MQVILKNGNSYSVLTINSIDKMNQEMEKLLGKSSLEGMKKNLDSDEILCSFLKKLNLKDEALYEWFIDKRIVVNSKILLVYE